MPTDADRLAVLIDSDNTTASLTSELLAEIAKYGTPTVKRAYGDWTTPNLEYVQDDPTTIVFRTVRKVKRGDELTIDYGDEWWETRGLEPG